MALRVGLGTDLHKLLPGDGIRLGGVKVPCEYRCEAESDGDVVLHALVDALLGAVGLGDIGDYYTKKDVCANEDSRRFVVETLERLGRFGVNIINVDCVINLERPKLAALKRSIRESLAGMLALPVSRVNVKAKTNECLGAVGRGEAVSAQVLLLMEINEGA